MELATARIAFFAPRRLLIRRNCARRWQSFLRVAAHAALIKVGLSQGVVRRVRVERRLPALRRNGHRSRPRNQMTDRWEAAHVRANFSDEDARRGLAEAGWSSGG